MSERKREWINIAILIVIALFLLFFIQPGMVESPYNDF